MKTNLKSGPYKVFLNVFIEIQFTYHEIYPLKVYTVVGFSMFTELYSHPPKRNPKIPLSSTHPYSQITTYTLSV